MRTRLFVFTGLSLWLSVFASPTSASDNLITNPGFEDVPAPNPTPNCLIYQGILPSDWIVVNSTPDTYSNDGSYGLPPTACGYNNFTGVEAYEGIRWVAAWSAANEQLGQWLPQSLNLGLEYEMSAWLHEAIRSDLTNPGGYNVYLSSGNDLASPTAFLGFLGPTAGEDEDWQPHSFTFTVTEEMVGKTFLRFVPVPTAAGSTYPGLDLVYLGATVPPNNPPSADAGENQSVHVGDTVGLDGSGSHDDETATEDLEYNWVFIEVPLGSTAALNGFDTMTPSFESDAVGDYVIRLVVNDGELSSIPDEVMVSTLNSPPNADAGEDQGVLVGTIVDLDGSGSEDPDGDVLDYEWEIDEMPEGSIAVLNNPLTVNPWFQPDVAGAYDIKLTVDDGHDKDKDVVTVLATALDDYVCERMIDSLNLLAAMPESSFSNKGGKKALTKFARLSCENAQLEDLEEAQHKLEQALSRTDGCFLRGEPDGAGGGFALMKDSVVDCADQALIYPLILEALEAITASLP